MLKKLTAADLMEPLITSLPAKATVREALAILERAGAEAAPVVDDEGSVVGLAGRNRLSRLAAGGRSEDTLDGHFKDQRFIQASAPAAEAVEAAAGGASLVVDASGLPLGILRAERLLPSILSWAEGAIDGLFKVLAGLPAALIVADAGGRVVLFNPAAERLTGLAAAEALGRPVTTLIPGRWEDAFRSGAGSSGERVVIGANSLALEVAPVPREGRPAGACGILTRWDAHNSGTLLRTLEAVLDNAYEGIVVVDSGGTITMLNKPYADFFGVRAEDYIGRHVTELIPNSRMHIVVKTGVPEIGHVWRVKGRDMMVHRIPIIENGQVVGAVGKVVFKNLEEIKVLARSVNQISKSHDYQVRADHPTRSAKYRFDEVVGTSQAIQRAKNLAVRVARGSASVLLRGESGTGKELFAHAIHDVSPRGYGPFVRLNCAAIPRELLESELFGYEPGAFTGARKVGKPGKFELASGGTLFLDEIGDMPLDMQAKLLRVLQEREIQKIGGSEPVPVDIRLITATNHNLERLVAEGKFRDDLYYRINVVSIQLPPLRERPEDVPLIASKLMRRLGDEMRIAPKVLDPATLGLISGYHWPGNVRELANLMEYLANTVEEEVILPDHLPQWMRAVGPAGEAGREPAAALRGQVGQAERRAILEALRSTGGNKLRAASLLGISRSRLYVKLKELGLGTEVK